MSVTGLVIVTVCGCFQEAENDATVCVLPADSPFTADQMPEQDQQFVAGEPLKIAATFFFGVDTRVRGFRCTAVQAEDRLILIETAYEWKGHSGSDAIAAHDVSCQTPALPAGRYVFKYGTQEAILYLPSTSPAPCLMASGE